MPTANAKLSKAADLKDAQSRVDKHISPKECMVWYTGNKDGWEPIPGTGCAHYVAHKLGIKGGKSGVCNAGYKFRVPDLIVGMTKLAGPEVCQQGDVWVNAGLTHTGLVASITVAGGKRQITIEHCSSGQGGVVTNDWATHFHGKGSFYRPVGSGQASTSTANTRSRQSGFPVREAFA